MTALASATIDSCSSRPACVQYLREKKLPHSLAVWCFGGPCAGQNHVAILASASLAGYGT